MILLVLLLYALCGLSFTLSKFILSCSAPLFFVAVRMIVSGIALYICFSFSSPIRKKVRTEDYMLFLQTILFHIVLAYTCDAWALQYMDSTESAFLYDLSPFFAAFFSYISFKERFTAAKITGICLGFFSLMILLSAQTKMLCSTNFLATAVMLVAVASGAYGWIVIRKLMMRGYSILFCNSISMFFGGILVLLSSAYSEQWYAIYPVTNISHFLLSLLLLMVTMNGAFYNLYGYLLTQYSPTFLAFAGFTCPFFVQFFGWFFLSEAISKESIVPLCIITWGLFIFYKEELKGEHKT